MPSRSLTTDDLDKIAATSFTAPEPLAVASSLVEAVDEGRIADEADVGYALTLAAEIVERIGDLDRALMLAERAAEAYQIRDPEYGYPRAFRAGLLLRLEREDEGLAELSRLRPQLTRDPDAASYVSETLEAAGKAEIAEQWLGTALETAIRRQESADSGDDHEAAGRAAGMAYVLMQERHRVRRSLDLPHDEYDNLADQLRNAVRGVLDDELGPAGGEMIALFWPKPEFDRLLERWPSLAADYGSTWDEHRDRVQRDLQAESDAGTTVLMVVAGKVDELAKYAERRGGDITDPEVREDYADSLAGTRWPPGRNESCWCGSGLKYKKCCLPRSRS